MSMASSAQAAWMDTIARILADRRVKLADVDYGKPTGYIAIADENCEEGPKWEKGRKYR